MVLPRNLLLKLCAVPAFLGNTFLQENHIQGLDEENLPAKEFSSETKIFQSNTNWIFYPPISKYMWNLASNFKTQRLCPCDKKPLISHTDV